MPNIKKLHKYNDSHFQQRYDWRNRLNPQDSRNNKAFFIKPRLEVNNSLKKYRHKITVCRGKRENGTLVDPEDFDVYIWTFDIHNKYSIISEFVRKCSASLYLDQLATGIDLRWKPFFEPTTTYEELAGLTVDNTPRKEYQRRLGYEYSDILLSKGTETNNIPKGEHRELYFLLTFSESNNAFLITDEGTMGWREDMLSKHVNDVFLMLSIPSKSKIHINLNVTNKVHRFELEIKSYDEINLNSSFL